MKNDLQKKKKMVGEENCCDLISLIRSRDINVMIAMINVRSRDHFMNGVVPEIPRSLSREP